MSLSARPALAPFRAGVVTARGPNVRLFPGLSAAGDEPPRPRAVLVARLDATSGAGFSASPDEPMRRPSAAIDVRPSRAMAERFTGHGGTTAVSQPRP